MSAFLAACRCQPTPFTPVCLVSPFGFAPKAREVLSRVGLEGLSRDPRLASEVSIDAAAWLGLDAVVLASDPQALVAALRPEGARPPEGDDRADPASFDVDRLPAELDVEGSLPHLIEAVRRARASLGGRLPLVSVTTAPFSLLLAVLRGEGRASAFAADRGAWGAAMGRLVEASARLLGAQIDAGLDAVLLRDDAIVSLTPSEYAVLVQPFARSLVERVGARVPTLHLTPAPLPLLREVRRSGVDGVTLGHDVALGPAWRALVEDGPLAIHGNLDPSLLRGPLAELLEQAERLVDAVAAQRGHIFGWGGEPPLEASPEAMRALVERVHDASQRTNPARPSVLPPRV